METDRSNSLTSPAQARSNDATPSAWPARDTLRRGGFVLLGFMLPALLLYASAFSSFATTIPGGPTAQKDGWQNVWNLWWTAFALRHGQNPLYTTWLYYPDGIGLFWQTLNVTNGLLALPITLAVGPVAAYNALALTSFVLSGITMYLLARELGASRVAAFVAGLLFSFSPLHVARLVDGQLEHMAIQWLPLYALLLVRGLRRGSWRATVGAALVLLWITLTSLYQALSCLILLGLYAAALCFLGQETAQAESFSPRRHGDAEDSKGWLFRPNRSSTPWPKFASRFLRLALRVGLIATIWLLPLLGPLLSSLGEAPDDDWLDSQALHSATPLDFVLPNPNHLLWGDAVSRFGQGLHPNAGSWNMALGLALVLLALAGLLLSRALRREPWPWVALGCLALALGPVLVVNGVATGFPLPYALINLLPAAGLGQRPNYLALPALLALAIVAARGLDLLLTRVRRPALLLAGLGIVLLVDLAPAPLALTDPNVPEALRQLGADPAPGAVLELPFLPESSAPLQAQIMHQRPIMGGFVSRTPYYPFPLERPALRAFWTGATPDELITPPWNLTANSLLRHYGIRYIVVRWRELPTSARARLSTQIAALPQGSLQQRYDFQGLSVYQVSAAKPLLPFAFERGMHPAERSGQRVWQWMGEQAELVLVNPDAGARVVTLSWQAEAFHSARDLAITLRRPNGPAQPLLTAAIATAPTAGQLRLVLPPGETTLGLSTSAEPASADDPRRLGVAFTRLNIDGGE